jgi:dTDP-glucose pyrophosphorylase
MDDHNYLSPKRIKKDWHELLIDPEMVLRDVIAFIDRQARQIAIVANDDLVLLGTITDGDIRRGILRGLDLDVQCREVMNISPTVFNEGTPREKIFGAMKERGIRHIPLLGEEGQIKDILSLEDALGVYQIDNPVVIMAGGLGKRLGSLTKDTPKPMLRVGGKPILETILMNFIDQGFHRFHVSVNYLSEVIMDYFGDGSAWGVTIKYLYEDKPLGTAGALGNADSNFEKPIIVMNGDLLTKVNFQNLLQFHEETKSMATMCVREFDFEVPYGVVLTEGHRLVGIDEKPVHRFFINAGIYVLEPKTLKEIPSGEFFNMTHLFEKMIENNHGTSSFPIHEYWKDIGQIPDLNWALDEFASVFSK